MKSTDPAIVLEYPLKASAQKVWTAITDIGAMKQWYFPQIKDFKSVLGFETNFLVQVEDRSYTHLWKITEVEPGQLITYTWNFKEYKGRSAVCFEIIENPEGTVLKLTNTILADFPEDVPEFKRESCIEGWNYLIGKNLNEYLAENASID